MASAMGLPCASHTATASIRFANHTQNATNHVSQTGPPGTNMNVVAQDTGDACDMLFSDPNSAGCQFGDSSTVVICSIMGAIFSYNASPFQVTFEAAWTWSQKLLQIQGSCDTESWPFQMCHWQVFPNCTNTAGPSRAVRSQAPDYTH